MLMQIGSTEVPMEEMADKQITFAEIKDYIMSFPPKTKLVRIYDACLSCVDLECLFHDKGWLCGDVRQQILDSNKVIMHVQFVILVGATFALNYR
jgi:hypothetical protein